MRDPADPTDAPKKPRRPNRRPADPNIVTTKQLADMLGHSEQTIQRWARGGKIPALWAGKDLRFELDKVLAALEAQHAARIDTRRADAKVPAEPDLDALPRARRTRSTTATG